MDDSEDDRSSTHGSAHGSDEIPQPIGQIDSNTPQDDVDSQPDSQEDVDSQPHSQEDVDSQSDSQEDGTKCGEFPYIVRAWSLMSTTVYLTEPIDKFQLLIVQGNIRQSAKTKQESLAQTLPPRTPTPRERMPISKLSSQNISKVGMLVGYCPIDEVLPNGELSGASLVITLAVAEKLEASGVELSKLAHGVEVDRLVRVVATVGFDQADSIRCGLMTEANSQGICKLNSVNKRAIMWFPEFLAGIKFDTNATDREKRIMENVRDKIEEYKKLVAPSRAQLSSKGIGAEIQLVPVDTGSTSHHRAVQELFKLTFPASGFVGSMDCNDIESKLEALLLTSAAAQVEKSNLTAFMTDGSLSISTGKPASKALAELVDEILLRWPMLTEMEITAPDMMLIRRGIMFSGYSFKPSQHRIAIVQLIREIRWMGAVGKQKDENFNAVRLSNEELACAVKDVAASLYLQGIDAGPTISPVSPIAFAERVDQRFQDFQSRSYTLANVSPAYKTMSYPELVKAISEAETLSEQKSLCKMLMMWGLDRGIKIAQDATQAIIGEERAYAWFLETGKVIGEDAVVVTDDEEAEGEEAEGEEAEDEEADDENGDDESKGDDSEDDEDAGAEDGMLQDDTGCWP